MRDALTQIAPWWNLRIVRPQHFPPTHVRVCGEIRDDDMRYLSGQQHLLLIFMTCTPYICIRISSGAIGTPFSNFENIINYYLLCVCAESRPNSQGCWFRLAASKIKKKFKSPSIWHSRLIMCVSKAKVNNPRAQRVKIASFEQDFSLPAVYAHVPCTCTLNPIRAYLGWLSWKSAWV